MNIIGKRCISFFLLLTVLFISGCGHKEKTASQTTLHFTFYGDIRNKPFGEALIAAFQKKYPSIRIEPVFIVSGYDQKLLTMVAGGSAPDLMVLSYSAMVDFASKGILLNLQSYLDKDKEFQSFKSDIHPGSLEACKFKDTSYGVPFWTDSLVLFYNKDLFDKEGLKYPDENWNWNNILYAGKRLTKDINNDGRIDQYGFFSNSFTIVDTMSGLYLYIKQNGGELFTRDMSKCLITSPESKEAIGWCFDLINKYKISPARNTGDERLKDYEQAFLSGMMAITVSGRWSVPWFAKAKFRWSCAPNPKGKVNFKSSDGALLGVYGKTKYPDECWEFLKFMMGKEAQEIVCSLKSDIPVRMSVADSPTFLNGSGRPEENKVFLKELQGAKGFPHFPGENEWLSRADRKLQLVLLGKENLNNACREIAEEYQTYRKK